MRQRVIPTMRDLLDDPVYRAYVKRVPKRHPANATGEPWQIWVRTAEGRWLTKRFPTYRDAWPLFIKSTREHADATLTSRRVFYGPPGEYRDQRVRIPARGITPARVEIQPKWHQTFFWPAGLEWCGRCRRPSFWQPLPVTHHALRNQPAVATDDNVRCWVCGIRWIGQPLTHGMERIV